jgi:xylan 1,4-beta-xylosidase
MLHQLGDHRLPLSSDSALATRRSDGSLAIALWNYAPPDGIGASYTPPPATRGPSKTFTLQIAGVAPNTPATILRLDEDHGNVIKAYDAMGRPAFPSRSQIVTLRESGRAAPAEHTALKASDLTLQIPPQGLVLVILGNKAAR